MVGARGGRRGSPGGRKTEIVTFTRPTEGAVDTYLGRTVTWATVLADVWAEIVPSPGTEGEQGRAAVAIDTYRVIVWWAEALAAGSAGWRVQWGARVLEAQGPPIAVDGRRVELEFLCRAVAS